MENFTLPNCLSRASSSSFVSGGAGGVDSLTEVEGEDFKVVGVGVLDRVDGETVAGLGVGDLLGEVEREDVDFVSVWVGTFASGFGDARLIMVAVGP